MAFEFLQDPERVKEQREEQAKRRGEFPHVTSRSPAQSNYLFGMARVEQALARLKVKPDDPALFEQIADGYALQAMFEEAAAFSLDEKRKVLYRERAEAVKNIGVQRCACPSVVRVASKRDAKGEEAKTQRPIEEVWAGGRVVQITRCEFCGVLSAR